MNPRSRACLMAGLLTLASAPMLAATTEVDRPTQTRLEMTTRALVSRTVPASVTITADVIDPTPLARLAEDVIAAEVAANVSGAERQRTQALWTADGNVSRKVVEAAEAQAAMDQARVRQLRAQLRLEWGARYASLKDDVLRQRALALVDGRTVLLRAQILGTPPAGWSPSGAHITLMSGGTRSARVLGPLPRATTGLIADWLLEADGEALVPGMHMTGDLDDPAHQLSGVVLPRSAIVRWNGLAWAYVAVDATHFERRAVTALRVLDDGWLMGAPFKAGEQVVASGANALMAIDVRGPGTATDKAAAPDGDD